MPRFAPDDSVSMMVQPFGSKDPATELKLWTSYNITVACHEDCCHSFKATPVASPEQLKLLGRHPHHRVEVSSSGAPQYRGFIQEIGRGTTQTDRTVEITGRSALGILKDAAIPLNRLNLQGLSLRRIAENWVAPYIPDYITELRFDAAAARYIMAGGNTAGRKGSTVCRSVDNAGANVIGRCKPPPKGKKQKGRFGKRSPSFRGVNTEVIRRTRLERGTTVLDGLESLAEQTGVMLWEGPNAELLMTRPTYAFPPDAYDTGLTCRWDSKAGRAAGGNVLESRLDTNIAERASEYRVVTSLKGKRAAELDDRYHTRTIKDPCPGFWERLQTPPYLGRELLHRPAVISAKGIYSPAIIARIARRKMLEAALGGLSLTYVVRGHHSPNGHLWIPDTMVPVDDDSLGIYEDFWIYMVERRFDQQNGRTSVLHLMPPDLWLGEFDTDTMPALAFYKGVTERIWW